MFDAYAPRIVRIERCFWNDRRMISRYLLIALGGMAGASIRWAVGTMINTQGFPWPIFAVNVVGCAILGILLAEEWEHPSARLWLQDFGGIGFCGGLTTMSSFATGIVNLAEHGEATMAVVYVMASVVVGFAAMAATAIATRHLRAISLPLEEAP